MRLARLVRRNLFYYWRGNLAVVAGVATAVAVLTGALLVGDSVRGSLRDRVLDRLGNTESVVTSAHWFRARLAAEMATRLGSPGSSGTICPVLRARGIAVAEKSGRRAQQVEVYGVDDAFWLFHGLAQFRGPAGRELYAGESLSRELQLEVGDTVLLRVEKGQEAPQESLFGHRDDPGRTLRLRCAGVLARRQLGEFSVRPGGSEGLTVFVPLGRLQRDLGTPGGANTLLVSGGHGPQEIRRVLRAGWTLADAGVVLRTVSAEGALSVESPGVLLSDALARAATDAAQRSGIPASPLYTYLATTIRCGTREIPYAVITAADLGSGALARLPRTAATGPPPAEGQAVWLNDWAVRELRPGPGEPVEISYFVWCSGGRLDAETVQFRFAGTVQTGAAAGPSMAPDFPGITEATTLTEWDPPFPFDLRRIRPEDERYWDEYRTTPKAFIALDRGRSLWGTRFGGATSVRLCPSGAVDLQAASLAYAAVLRNGLDVEHAGFDVTDVRALSLKAALGSTDFGQYFLYFSFFLIAASLLLSGLFFRLGIEQRVHEVGALTAAGFAPSRLRSMFLVEAAAIAGAGTVVGLPAAAAYAALLLHGLGTWWTGATGATRLSLHVSWVSFAVGAAMGIAAALLSTALTLRGLGRSSARALLAGVFEDRGRSRTRARIDRAAAAASLALAAAVLAAARAGALPETAGFFTAGSLLLVCALSACSLFFRRIPEPLGAGGWRAVFRLGALNAGYRAGRSLSCVALIAGATFVIVSLEAFRQSPATAAADRRSGTGGFALAAESTLPLAYDLNGADGRTAVGLQDDLAGFRALGFTQFRVRPGDDTSCLNLYAPQEPRLLGVPRDFIQGGRFRFGATPSATTAAARANPWLLLEAEPPDGAVPAIADANTIRYTLHRAPGDLVTVRAGDGGPVRLRLVAALRDSIFQSELLISESNFLKYFPDQEGFRFFLVDVDPSQASEVARRLEDRLADWGFDAQSAPERLASYHQVEDTYLSTFQSLGGFGLLLGSVGMAAVLLRNVLERRKELALLRAVGFSRGALVATVLSENAVLVGLGLLSGTVAALFAVGPALVARAHPFPIASVLTLVCSVFAVGLAASLLAAVAAFRAPLLAALRSE